MQTIQEISTLDKVILINDNIIYHNYREAKNTEKYKVPIGSEIEVIGFSESINIVGKVLETGLIVVCPISCVNKKQLSNQDVIEIMQKEHKAKQFNNSALHDFLATCGNAPIFENKDYLYKSNIMDCKDLRLWKKSFRVSCLKHVK